MNHMSLPDDRLKEQFLRHFDPPEKSSALNCLLFSVRSGAGDVEGVLDALRRDLSVGPKTPTRERLRVLLCNSPDTVRKGAAYALAWEKLSPEEKQRFKRARQNGYLEEWRACVSPTQAQLDFLVRLGHRGPTPQTRAGASALGRIRGIRLTRKLLRIPVSEVRRILEGRRET